MRLMYFSVFLSTVSFLSFNANHLTAECAKCVKIEAEREEEKARNPRPKSEYYEDQLSLNDHIEQIQLPTDAPEAGILEGSSYRSSTASQGTEARRLDRADVRSTDASLSSSLISFLLESKDIAQTLKGPFTLFVPSNEALRKLPPHLTQNVLNLDNREKIDAIVKNHIVAKKITKADFSNDNSKINSLNNQVLTLKDKNGELLVNQVRILRSETLGNNGMIYIIDQVLLP